MSEYRDLNGQPVKTDIHKILKEKKKKEIIEAYKSQSSLSYSVLENIYDFCDMVNEKKIKQIKKGLYKNTTNFKPKRPNLKGGDIFETVKVRDLTEEEMKPKILDFSQEEKNE